MGFSVSGSVVVLLFGLFIALGTIHASGVNTLERISDSRDDQLDHSRHVHETAINVSSVSVSNISGCDLELHANNTGETVLSLNETDLLLDNELETGWQDPATVDGDAGTDLWQPDQELVVTRNDIGSAPDGVMLATKHGVTSRVSTEGLAC